jgi:hypothetical protein
MLTDSSERGIHLLRGAFDRPGRVAERLPAGEGGNRRASLLRYGELAGTDEAGRKGLREP